MKWDDLDPIYMDLPPTVTLGRLKDSIRPMGVFTQMIGDHWLIFFVDVWESTFRRDIAEVFQSGNGQRGIQKVKSAEMADLNKVRNDIVHNLGMASEQNVGKMRIFTSWFEIQEGIHVTPVIIHDILQRGISLQLETVKGVEQYQFIFTSNESFVKQVSTG